MQQVASLNFTSRHGQAIIVHSVRLLFLAIVLVITIVFQLIETRIVSREAFFPIYAIVSISFLFQCLYLYFFEQLESNKFVSGLMFVVEALYIASLIYFIGVQQSLLIFLFLVNIILCGILFQRQGAMALALVTSILFSFTLSLDQTVQGHTAFLAIGVNNLAFFTVAYLSGYLSEQLNLMGVELRARGRDIKALRNLNDLILRNMNSGLITMQSDGVVIQVNNFAKKILKSVSGRFVGAEISQILNKFDLFNFKNNQQRSFNYIYHRDNDDKRQLRMHLAELKDQEEESKGYILTFQDETELRELEGRVRQSEKLAAIGQLAAGIAHEIRNPLASISGSIQLLQAGSDQNDENKKLMNIVSREIDRLNVLITEFLDYAKPEAPKEDEIHLGELLKEILEFTKVQYQEQNISTQIEVASEISMIGNRDKLRQAFMNIIVNAFQALQKRENGSIIINVHRSQAGAKIKISDNGSGIEEKVVNRIFEPFLTTKVKGTGLGLAITHSIIQSHKGHISVDSTINQGTTFHIELPI